MRSLPIALARPDQVDPFVAALRRYPVKSMGGEALTEARLTARGIVGDRRYAVRDGEGRLASGKNTRHFRRRDAVFDHAASTDPEGQVVVSDGHRTWTVGDPVLDHHLTTVMAADVTVAPETDVPHQDASPLSIVGTATLSWCSARWGGSADPRRIRANVVLETDTPFVEEAWVGRELTLGSALLRLVERVPRCRMVDLAQDGVEPGTSWLSALGRERDLCLAVYADVLHPGTVSLGDRPRLSPRSDAAPR